MRSILRTELISGGFRTLRTTLGLALVLTATAGSLVAGGGPPPPVPEIDPGSATSALALLTGGILMLTDRLWPR